MIAGLAASASSATRPRARISSVIRLPLMPGRRSVGRQPAHHGCRRPRLVWDRPHPLEELNTAIRNLPLRDTVTARPMCGASHFTDDPDRKTRRECCKNEADHPARVDANGSLTIAVSDDAEARYSSALGISLFMNFSAHRGTLPRRWTMAAMRPISKSPHGSSRSKGLQPSAHLSRARDHGSICYFERDLGCGLRPAGAPQPKPGTRILHSSLRS